MTSCMSFSYDVAARWSVMSWYESQFPWQFLIKKSESRSRQEPIHRASIPAEELGVAAWPVNKEPAFAVHGDPFVSQPPAVKIALGFWDQDFTPYRNHGYKVWVWVTVTYGRSTYWMRMSDIPSQVA